MKIGPTGSVAALKEKFQTGKANNAIGAPSQHSTAEDDALALSNNRRALFQFADMNGTVTDEQRQRDEEASLQLALQLQLEEEALFNQQPAFRN